MEEKRFEKQVKERLDELKIQPLEEVWQKVKAGIAEKKRRRWPVILLFFVLLTGSAYIFWNTTLKHVSKDLSITIRPADTISMKHSSVAVSNDSVTNNTTNTTPYKTIIAPLSLPHLRNIIFGSSSASFSRQNKKFHHVVRKYSDDEDATFSSSTITEMDTDEEKKADDALAKNNTIHDFSANENSRILKDSVSQESHKDSASQKKVIVELIKKSDSVSYKKTAAKAIRINNKWKFGITFIPGISSIKNKLLYASSQNSSVSSPGNLGGTNTNFGTYSSVHFYPCFGIIAGIVAEKKIFKNIQLVTGISYTKLSVSNSLPDSVLGLYSANHMQHFSSIEIPLAVKFDFSIAKLPIFIQPAISFSKLIKYNNTAAASAYNTTFINLTTTAGVSLFSKTRHPILIGPYVRYQAGSIASKGLYKDSYFLFTGLSALFFIINK